MVWLACWPATAQLVLLPRDTTYQVMASHYRYQQGERTRPARSGLHRLITYDTVSLDTLSFSSSACISLLTCGPGDEFYSTFGHTALRVYDSLRGIDLVYNYGTFDFDQPHFYLRFAQGRLLYALSCSSYEAFVHSYAQEGRWVVEQRLNVDSSALSDMVHTLSHTLQTDSLRHYHYDFFMDNCATRVRDIMCQAIPLQDSTSCHTTFRSLLSSYMADSLEWWQLGIDMVLGARCDQEATGGERMFFPRELMERTAVVDSGQFVGSTHQLLKHCRQPLAPSWHPWLIAWLLYLFVLAASIAEVWAGWRMGWMDVLLFLLVGMASLIIIFLWFFSDHYCTKANWNILWCNPLALYFAFARRRSKRWLLIAQGLAMAVVVVGFNWLLPQHFNPAVLPIVLLLMLRLFCFRFTTPRRRT